MKYIKFFTAEEIEKIKQLTGETPEGVSCQIRNAIDLMKGTDLDYGCITIKLDKHLGISVGWSELFSDTYYPETLIPCKVNPDLNVCIGLKVWTSDNLRTDFDLMNFPTDETMTYDYYDAVPVEADEEYCDFIACQMLKNYLKLSDFELNNEGQVIGVKPNEN